MDGSQHIGANFLADVFGPSTALGRVFVCSLINSDDRIDGRGGERFVCTRDRNVITAFVSRWDAPRRGLYYCTSTLKPNARRRAKDTLAEIALLHADLDFKSVTASPDEVRRALRESMRPPSIVVNSGHGLHPLWLFKESLAATPENIAEVERLLRLLIERLGADPAAAECSRLLRLPGTHNTKHGEWTEVRFEVYAPARRYGLDELRDWLSVAITPRLHRYAREGKTDSNGGGSSNPFIAAGHAFKPPIDVKRRLAAMQYQGPGESGIHFTQLAVSASLLTRGVSINAVVAALLTATRIAAGKAGQTWNWQREERDLLRMCFDWLKKHPELAPVTATAPED
jgi:hypothetical protein